MTTIFDIVIVGAGPAGATLALFLRNSGYSVALLEQNTYPRDKICGDAIPFDAYRTLQKLGASYYDAMFQLSSKYDIKSCRIVTAKGRQTYIQWTTKAFNCPRLVFDNQLFEWVKSDTATQIFEQTKVKSTVRVGGVWEIKTASGEVFKSKFLVGAGGANCPIARHTANITIDRKTMTGSVRAYFEGVTGGTSNENDIYLSNNHSGYYFWVFPVGDNIWNVGLGLSSEMISKEKVNLNNLLHETLTENPLLKSRFKNAKQLGKTRGFPIPLGGLRRVPLSGEGFLLIGDAASLADPIGGDGIGTGMWSAEIAAAHLQKALQNNDFSANAMQRYDEEVYGTIGKVLEKRAKLQRFLLRFPRVVEVAAHPALKKVMAYFS